MKGLCSIAIIWALLSICASEIQAQPVMIYRSMEEGVKHSSGTGQNRIISNTFSAFGEGTFRQAIHGNSNSIISPDDKELIGKFRVNSYQSQSFIDAILNPKNRKVPKTNLLQSSTGGVQKIDSSLWERWDTLTSLWIDESKEVLTYDGYGNVTSIDYGWDETLSQWIGQRKDEVTYDSYGNETLWIEYQWDISTSQWVSFYKDKRAYDGFGNITLRYIYEWDITTSQWVITFKFVNTIDTSGHITLAMVYEWDKTRSQFINNWKTEFTYNAREKATLIIGYHWDITASQWVGSFKEEYTYDGSGNKTTEIISNWNNAMSQWVGTKYDYTYDANGNETSYTSHQWDSTTGQWLSAGKEEITYGTNSKQLIFSNWDTTNSLWVNSHKDELVSDGNGKITFRYAYEWDISTSKWVDSFKEESTFDAYGNQTLWIYSAWDKTTSQLIPAFRETFYYSEHNIMPEIPDRQIYVYPNPSSEYVLFDPGNISGPAIVEIFSNQGRKVLEQDISENRQINISKLARGLYLYRLKYSGKIYNGKIIVN